MNHVTLHLNDKNETLMNKRNTKISNFIYKNYE